MTQRHRLLSSLRLKTILTAFIVVLLVASSGLLFLLVSRIFARVQPSIRADLEWRTLRGAVEAAQRAPSGIERRDPKLLAEALAVYRQNADVLALVVLDDRGRVLFRDGAPPETPAALCTGPAARVREEAGYLVAWAPARIDGRAAGKVAIAISKARLAEGERLRRSILSTAGIGCLLALCLSLFFVNSFIGPILKLTSRTLDDLRQLNGTLESRVAERTAQLSTTNHQLVEASRRAGMADVATAVLHNVGNVLNSINVSADLVCDAYSSSRTNGLGKVAAMLDAHKAELGAFLSDDPKGKLLPDYVSALAEAVTRERQNVVEELALLKKNVDHIKVIVSMQQSHAKSRGSIESVSLPEMLEDALQLNLASHSKHGVEVERDYQPLAPIETDRHKLFQIVMNLLSNARHAIRDQPDGARRIILRTRQLDGGCVSIEVADTGVGIPPENRSKIFSHGFTTKKDGHGFGLHSSACAAIELGGSLRVHSDGPGRGTSFTLVVPAESQAVTNPFLAAP